MPRYSRKLGESSTYHVMIRGNEKKEIFIDDEDRNRFVDTLDRMRGDNNYTLYAYCLMSNHVHLLMSEGQDSISRAMKRISVSYAYYFNKKYDRVGHLFQDRFRSEVIDSDSYLLTAARYIHNNPVKAAITKNASEYKWSSFKEYIGNSRLQLVETGLLLDMFSLDKANAVKRLIEFTNETVEDTFINCDDDSIDEIEGDSEVRQIITKLLSRYKQDVGSLKACMDKGKRNDLIRVIKEETGAPVRQLSRVLGISKDIIFRA